ncbi:rcc01693 family protein [Allorhizobium borbori]|uniref:Putative phage protein (TIGR02216 family) n=1 Tax=Allorhizobium borbori TaxID=485907 RepID=A0A7W6K661_9HYPH|nr:rcc01693 family protein [Allorhizobium borbori]MBB4104855.1 putative phage protein (TIGR02216 family) [Allorhizobium borbori]
MSAAAGAPGPFPWGEALHAGLCLLRLPPAVFWAMTPREFFAATGGLKPRGAAPARGDLDALMREFPDRKG